MLWLRLVLLLLLLAAGVYFAYYVGTGQERFKTNGLRLLKLAVWAGLGFFAALFIERLL
jgi:hypothetical protein